MLVNSKCCEVSFIRDRCVPGRPRCILVLSFRHLPALKGVSQMSSNDGTIFSILHGPKHLIP